MSRREFPVLCTRSPSYQDGWWVTFVHHVYKRLPAPAYMEDHPLASFFHEKDADQYAESQGGWDAVCKRTLIVRLRPDEGDALSSLDTYSPEGT